MLNDRISIITECKKNDFTCIFESNNGYLKNTYL